MNAVRNRSEVINMKINILLIVLLPTLFLLGCEGYRCAKGIVKDKSTNLKLDSVLCYVTTSREVFYTDTSGAFNVCNRMGGCVGSKGCPDIIVEFSKPGYKSLLLKNPEDDMVVYLEK